MCLLCFINNALHSMIVYSLYVNTACLTKWLPDSFVNNVLTLRQGLAIHTSFSVQGCMLSVGGVLRPLVLCVLCCGVCRWRYWLVRTRESMVGYPW